MYIIGNHALLAHLMMESWSLSEIPLTGYRGKPLIRIPCARKMKGGVSMSKPKAPLGLYKSTVHDGSVSYSVLRLNPRDGLGNSTKTEEQRVRRHWFYHMANITPTASKTILAMYRGEF